MAKYLGYVGALLGDDASQWMQLDLSIVRGLAYYTGIVFEIFDRQGEMRAICGGGRYDQLLAASGGPDLPALGFGMGDVVLSDLVRSRGLMPPFASSLDVWVAAGAGQDADDRAVLAVTWLAGQFRAKGLAVEYSFRRQSLSRQLQLAAGTNARFAVIVNQPDAREGATTVRDLRTSEQSDPMAAHEAIDYVIAKMRTQRCLTTKSSQPARRISARGTTKSCSAPSWPTTVRSAAAWSSAPTGTGSGSACSARWTTMFKSTGVRNAYFPLLIPESFLHKEARARRGFRPGVSGRHSWRWQEAGRATRRATDVRDDHLRDVRQVDSESTATCRCW